MSGSLTSTKDTVNDAPTSVLPAPKSPQLVGDHSHDAKTTGSPAERFTSTNPDDFAVPKGREEEWRFTPIRVVRDFFNPIEQSAEVITKVTADERVEYATRPMNDPSVGRVLRPADRVSALAYAHSDEAFVVKVPASVELSEPVQISAEITAGKAYHHLVIEAGAFAHATVVIDYTGSGSVAENVEIVVGDSAELTFVAIYEEGSESVHLAAHALSLGRDASVRHRVISLGGRVVRVAPSVRYQGQGGSADLRGMAFAANNQHHEARLYVDHNTAHCKSNVVYKNGLQGTSARTVWIGDVRIRPAAIGTDTFELNRNLLLSDGARADSVPNLEIETGEIAGAGHASATGRFDDLQLFYLQARGIPEAVARRLVMRGFFADIIDQIPVEAVRERLMDAVDQRLDTATEDDLAVRNETA